MQAGSKRYTFDHAFGADSAQESIYSQCVEPMLDGCFEGLNATVFAFGQTGSGKTYTMGTAFDAGSAADESTGIIPRVMRHIMARVGREAEAEVATHRLSVGYLEIYKEEIRDLLQRTEKKLDVSAAPAHRRRMTRTRWGRPNADRHAPVRVARCPCREPPPRAAPPSAPSRSTPLPHARAASHPPRPSASVSPAPPGPLLTARAPRARGSCARTRAWCTWPACTGRK